MDAADDPRPPGERRVIDLAENQPIFIGFKLETGLRRQIEALSGSDRKYVSEEDSTFLRVCRVKDEVYVGKLIEERLTTQRVDDICRNIFSIIKRLFPDERLPHDLEIFAARDGQTVEIL
jgi:hypothetical protein